MSHQTGITCNDELLDLFGKCRASDAGDRYRLLKIVIRNEELTSDGEFESRGSWEEDWDSVVLPAVEDLEPCYLLYRLDEKEGNAYKWLFVCWSPDEASVRRKMLYASTKATLKKEFGGGRIKDELYGNVRTDITMDGYKKHRASEAAPGPLSREELERREVKTDVGVDTKQGTMKGIAFPLTSEALEALKSIKKVDYVRLRIDTNREIITLEESGSCSVPELPAKVPTEAPRYHLFNFKHTHEGDYIESLVFIYTMPGYNCSVKERMLYSSCRNALVEVVESLDISVAKKIEVEGGPELTEEFLREELHPVKSLNRPKFSRPAPPNRGNRRITKTPPS